MNKRSILVSIFCLLFSINSFAQIINPELEACGIGDFFYTVNKPVGNLKNYLPGYGCFGYGINLSFRRFSIEFGKFESDLRSLKSDFEFNGHWKKDTPTKYTSNDILLGYAAYDNEVIKLNVLGGGYRPKIVASKQYIKENESYSGMSVSTNVAPQLGLSFDARFPLEDYMVRRTHRSNYYLLIRARVIYQFANFNLTSKEMNGGFISYQIACGFVLVYSLGSRRGM
jgi:hypothetical protein